VVQPFKKVLTTCFNGGYPVCGAGLNSKTSNHERVHLHVQSQSQFVVCRDSVEMCQRDGLPTWMLLAYQKISSRWISARKRLQRNFRFQSQDTRQNHTFHLVVFIFFILFFSSYNLFVQKYTPIKWVELSTQNRPMLLSFVWHQVTMAPPWGNATRTHPASSTLHGARRDLFAGHLQRRPRRRNLEGFEWPVDQTVVGECRGALGWSKKVQNGNVKPGKMYEHVDESMTIAW